jgi:hypothetical protein
MKTAFAQLAKECRTAEAGRLRQILKRVLGSPGESHGLNLQPAGSASFGPVITLNP